MTHVSDLGYENMDPHSRRIFDANDWRNFSITEQNIRDSRQAYFANISYLDDKIGDVMEALRNTDQQEDTVIVFVSDHGDMLGERGLWFKMTFFEGSSRVPLMISSARMGTGQIDAPVSTMDITPTLAELANIDLSEVLPWTDGMSLVSLANGNPRSEPVLMEYAAEASYAPLVGIVDNNWKYVHCELDPPQLYHLADDPHELDNLAGNSEYADDFNRLNTLAHSRWNMAEFDAQVRESQARRWVVYEALRNGDYYPWDYQPLQKASERYMRNHMNLNEVEANARYPKE